MELPPGWGGTQDSSANSSQTLAKALEAGERHYIQAFEVALSAAAAASEITITLQDGSTVLWKTIIGLGAPRGERVGAVFAVPLRCTVATAAQLVVSAGGASAVTTASMAGYTL